jgi:SepF-like predicted cell division protein (DUF552 family)
VALGDEFSFVIEDKEEYFKFLVHTVTHTIAEPFSLEFNLFNHIAFTKITDKTATQPSTKESLELSVKPRVHVEKSDKTHNTLILVQRIEHLKDVKEYLETKYKEYSVYDYYGDSRTIDSHIKKIRHKLGKKGKYIETVRGVGYRLEKVH